MSSQRKNKRRPVYARATGMTLAPIDTSLPVVDRTAEPTPTPGVRDFTPDPEYTSTIFPELRRLFYRGDRPEPQSPSPAASILSEADVEALLTSIGRGPPDYGQRGLSFDPDTDSDEESVDGESKEWCGICWQQFSKESLYLESVCGEPTERCEKCREKSPLEQRITLVMSQTGSTHEVASAALESCSGDVVNAIMQLTC